MRLGSVTGWLLGLGLGAAVASGIAAERRPEHRAEHRPEHRPPFTVTSPAFEDGAALARKNASDDAVRHCGGQNLSPPLHWSSPPTGTRSFAIVMSDPDARSGLGVSHWVAYGIPARESGLREGAASQPSRVFVGGRNTRGESFYQGPCPAPGAPAHHYLFTVIASDLGPNALAPGLTQAGLVAAMQGHALAVASIVGRYAR